MGVYPEGRMLFDVLKECNLWHRGTESAGTAIVLGEVISGTYDGMEASE